jgi:hypothetical protein
MILWRASRFPQAPRSAARALLGAVPEAARQWMALLALAAGAVFLGMTLSGAIGALVL